MYAICVLPEFQLYLVAASEIVDQERRRKRQIMYDAIPKYARILI